MSSEGFDSDDWPGGTRRSMYTGFLFELPSEIFRSQLALSAVGKTIIFL